MKMSGTLEVTWLHLSDAHLCEQMTGWDSDRVLTSLIEDLKKLNSKFGLKPDAVFFTGDLVFGHSPERRCFINDQFNDGHQFLESLRNSFEPVVPADRMFIVPGNHDVNLTEAAESEAAWLEGLRGDTKAKVNQMISDGGLQWKRFAERLLNYRNFLESTAYSQLLQDPVRLCFAQVLDLGDYTLGIIGLNSAWSSWQDHEMGKLWLGEWQIKEMARKTFPYDPTLSGKHKKYEGYRLIASQKTDPELIELLDINPDAVPDLILSSPLKRAVQTANFFSKQKNTPMIIMDDLREVQFDLKNLVSEVEFNKHGSNLVRQRFINSFIEDDLIDSRQQLQNRLNKTLDFIKKCERDKILIVSHSFLLKILETYLNDSFLFERPKIIKSYFDTTQKTYEFGEGYNFCI